MGLCRHRTDTARVICAESVLRCHLTICSFFSLSTIKEPRKVATFEETLIRKPSSIERKTGDRLPDSAIPLVLCISSIYTKRGHFAEIWQAAITACGPDTNPTHSAALFLRHWNTGRNRLVKTDYKDHYDNRLGDTRRVPDSRRTSSKQLGCHERA